MEEHSIGVFFPAIFQALFTSRHGPDFPSQLVSHLQLSEVLASSHRPGRGFSTPPLISSPLALLPAAPRAVASSHQPGKDLRWPAHRGASKGGNGHLVQR